MNTPLFFALTLNRACGNTIPNSMQSLDDLAIHFRADNSDPNRIGMTDLGFSATFNISNCKSVTSEVFSVEIAVLFEGISPGRDQSCFRQTGFESK